jgi:hypothetical protein
VITSQTDLNALAKSLEREVAKMHAYTDSGYRDAVREVFSVIVKGTPQYTGTLAEHWFVSTEEPTSGRYPGPPERSKFGPIYQMGDEPAVTLALSVAYPVIDHVKFDQTVYVYNMMEYMEPVQEGIGPNGLSIRPENTVGGQVLMLRTAVLNATHNGWRF